MQRFAKIWQNVAKNCKNTTNFPPAFARFDCCNNLLFKTNTKELDKMGDRKTLHGGMTAHANPKYNEIVYDAEVKPPGCLTNVIFTLACISFNKERSYLYLRENSLETNFSIEPCCGALPTLVPAVDIGEVKYFDRSPYTPLPCSCLCSGDPTIELYTPGCQICCTAVEHPCMDKAVVIVPYQKCCFCCDNHTEKTFCGPYAGNAKVSFPFGMVEPNDPEAFATAAQNVIAQANAKLGK